MARQSGKSGEKGAAKTRKVKGRNPGKTKRHIAQTAIRLKRQPASALGEELKESREQQAATAGILKVIANSPSDVQPVFKAIAASANRLIGGFSCTVIRFIDGMAHLKAFTPTTAEADEILQSSFPQPVTLFKPWLRAQAGEVTHVPDTEAMTGGIRGISRARGFRSMLFVPLMSKGQAIGAIAVTRVQPGTFADHHVELLQTFADQAVIAIENVRLFNETKESLERQTATAEILKVIAISPSDVQPVFEAIAASATRLIGGFSSTVILFIDGLAHLKALTSTTPDADEILKGVFPRPTADFPPYQNARSGEIEQIPDTEVMPNELRDLARARGYRSVVFAPLENKGALIGVIGVTRVEPGLFSEHHLQLLRTFADQAVIAIENTRLFNEVQAKTRDLEEALIHQTGSANILKVIASSPTDVGPVLTAIVESACVICEAEEAHVALRDGDELVFQVQHGSVPVVWKRQPINRLWVTGRAAVDRRPVHMHDYLSPEGDEFPDGRELARRDGARTMLAVPLLRERECIGVIALRRMEVRPFSEKQIELLQTFADQAVIAIENARLFNETKEALARQTATADVLKVIASSPSTLQPVYDAIAERSKALIGAHSTVVVRYTDGMIELASFTPVSPEADATVRKMFPRRPFTGDPQNEQILRGEIARISDAETELQGNVMRDVARERGWRSRLQVPLKDDTSVIGWISITRKEPGGFADKDVELLRTFSDQAVIAIQNVKLFEEVQARTRDLQETLQQQTATSEVLQVISSSPGDLAPVFNKMLENATRVCGAEFGSMNLAEGDALRQAALYNAPPAFAKARANKVFRPHPQSAIATAISSKQVVHVDDLRNNLAYRDGAVATVELVDLGGARTVVSVPMLRDDEAVGVITVFRQEVRAFSDKQIELLTNFARQAVIAIENARLLKELRQRTDDLSEALTYQTGSANILRVIASSPTDVGPVLQAIVESACQLCEAADSVVVLKDGDGLVFAAHHGPIPVILEKRLLSRGFAAGRAVIDRVQVHIHDVLSAEGDEFPEARELSAVQGIRSVLSVPLMRDEESVGAILLRRTEAQSFSDKQIELLKSFADQAVIAISNVRLFEQVQERTRELSRSLEDLRAAQDRLVQTEKLASLGQLTAGIAHEIKNPLNFVNNFSALSVELTDELKDLLKQGELAEKIRQEVDELTQMLKSNLEKVVQHGKRADSIVKNMLLHSREGRGERRTVDINALVEESLNLAYHGARAERSDFQITLERDLDPAAGQIELYPQEITRALLNMISNGFYAATRRAGEAGKGFEPTLLAGTRGLPDRVEIRIRDNGPGIPPEVKDKMFNPFFTTKPAGEGTGLGLSMSHDIIVKQHGGTIDVETEPGAFTEIIVTLPRATSSPKRSTN